MTRIDRSAEAVPLRDSAPPAEVEASTAAPVSQAATANAINDNFQIAGGVDAAALLEAVERLAAPTPPPSTSNAQGAAAFAASVEIWSQQMQQAIAAGAEADAQTQLLTGIVASDPRSGAGFEMTGGELAFVIQDALAESTIVWEYGDEEFVRIQTEHRKQKDLHTEEVERLTKPQRILKHQPGGFHSVANPTERNASYEMITASQRVAGLVRAQTDLELAPPPITG